MRSAFVTEVARSIGRSKGRFLAIAGIVAIGCGFFAGLRMTGVGMRKAADIFYDGTRLYDIEVVSTLGLSEATVGELAEVEGVEQAMATRSVDVMATYGDQQLACRISSFDVDAARDSDHSSVAAVDSADEGYLNRLVLETGRWPEAPDECVVLDERVRHLGEASSVRVLYGSSDLDDVLEMRDFEIVGTVSSPLYVQSTSLATTTLGNGFLEQVLFVPDGAFIADSPYTECYLTVAGADADLSGSAPYERVVGAVEDAIDGQVDALAFQRQAEVRAKAQATLDENRATFEAERDDALAQLADAKAELDQGLAELQSGQADYDAGVAEIASSRRQLQDGEVQYAQGSREVADGEPQLAEARASLEANRAQLDTLRQGYERWQAGLAQWQEDERQALDQAKSNGISAGSVSELLDKLVDKGANDPESPLYSDLHRYYVRLEELVESRDQLDAAGKLVGSYPERAAEFAEGERQLAAEEDRLATAKAELAAARAQLDEGWRGLEAGEAELASAKAELDRGWADYHEGLATYEAEEADALERLAQAEAELDEAQATIDEVELPDIYVLDRTKNYGAESYTRDSERIDAIATVFPFFFFLVAALVALTTMTRMVDDERGLIGTYKALGYSTLKISSKYLAYAAIAAGVGAVIGIAVMSQLLPWVVSEAYSIVYHVPHRPFPLPVEPGPALWAVTLGLGSTLAATLAACLSSLRETPAALLQPKAPKVGKRILLERIGPLWRHTNFSWKVTLRNIFRYKRRFSMTVIGIAGCTALLVTGFGLRDAISDIIDVQYGEIVHHDMVVGLAEGSLPSELEDVRGYLEGTDDTGDVVAVDSANVVVRDATGTSDDHAVQLIVPEDAEEYLAMRTFRDRLTHEPVALDPRSVVLTEKLACELGVGPGDRVRLYTPNDAGNVTGEGVEVAITGVVENYIQGFVFMGEEAYRATYGHGSSPDTIYTTIVSDEDVRTDVSHHLQALPHVDTVVFEDDMIDTYRTMLRSVDLVMIVLILSAAALAFVVLYNLANINISERVREIASLKVLGFTRREVDAYVFREILIIVALGALVGLVLGYFFEGYVVVTAEVDAVMFGRTVHAASYVYSLLLTMAFAVLVLLAMTPKLARIDMVESLKSVE